MRRDDQTQTLTDAERLDVLAQCLLVFAERGAAIRNARAQKAKPTGNLGRDTADLANDSTTLERTVVYGQA